MLDLSRISEYYQCGKRDAKWYQETNILFRNLFPTEDINLIADLMAATSIHSTISTNVKQFFKARRFYYEDKPMTGFIPNMRMQLELVRAGKPLTGRKILNFSNAIKGDENAVVVDLWITRAFGMDAERGPTTKQYDAIEYYIQNTAPLLDLKPREFCASIWSGIRTIQTGRKNLTTYDRYLQREMAQTKMFAPQLKLSIS